MRHNANAKPIKGCLKTKNVFRQPFLTNIAIGHLHRSMVPKPHAQISQIKRGGHFGGFKSQRRALAEPAHESERHQQKSQLADAQTGQGVERFFQL